jgi:hypothetical protein
VSAPVAAGRAAKAAASDRRDGSEADSSSCPDSATVDGSAQPVSALMAAGRACSGIAGAGSGSSDWPESAPTAAGRDSPEPAAIEDEGRNSASAASVASEAEVHRIGS